MKKLNLKFYTSIIFILIAMVCSIAINMLQIDEPTQNMYKFILAVSTLLSTVLWVDYMIGQHN